MLMFPLWCHGETLCEFIRKKDVHIKVNISDDVVYHQNWTMNDNITFYLNRRGTRKATFRGYDYCKDREYKERMYWKCTNRLCGGRIITLEYIVVKETEHSLHGPDHAEVKKNLSMARIIPGVIRPTRPTEHVSSAEKAYRKNIASINDEQNGVMDMYNVSKQSNRDFKKEMCLQVQVDPSNNNLIGEQEGINSCDLKGINYTTMLKTEDVTDSSLYYDSSTMDVKQPTYEGIIPFPYTRGDPSANVYYNMSDIGSSDTYPKENMGDYAESNIGSNIDNIEELHQADLHIRLCMAMFRCKENADISLELSTANLSEHDKFDNQTQSRGKGLDEEEIKFLHDLLKYLDGLPS